jgi:hypothetical protein
MCLPDLDHNWSRYVMPAGQALTLSEGFLPDPEGRYEQYSNPGLLRVDQLFAARCCILVGDAGLGKSDILTKEYSRVRATGPQGTNAIFRSLRDFGSDVTARQFLTSPDITAWITDPASTLFLFLDSLDEALLKVDTWSSLLRDALSVWPVDRLWFRITCRPAFWPTSLGDELQKLFGDGFSKVNLAPLRLRDVESAAVEHDVAAELLLSEIHRANASTFAARPLTLKMIFGIFAESKKLPSRHTEMYSQGCRFLCGEHNPTVLEGRRMTNVPLDRRIAIAERMAAMSVFCDRRFIQHPNAVDPITPEGTLMTTEICSTDASAGDLREVLASGLFAYDSADVLTWTNWSHAEFLAASWCISQRLSLVSLKDLITVPGDDGLGVPQQLSSTAVWLCELRRELQAYLARLNPTLLLFIDVAAVDPSILPKLVKNTIERTTTWELTRQVQAAAHRFKYPGIVKQLARYLRHPRHQSRCAKAIHIAIACHVSDLDKILVKIAEDKTCSLEIRQLAASGIAQIGRKEAREAIRHFATNPVPEDKNDNLKGCALLANWPENLTLRDVMALLTRSRNSYHSGWYEAFLAKFSRELDINLPEDDVLTALGWAKQEWLTHTRDVRFDLVVDRILQSAWAQLESATIRESFVSLLLARLRHHIPAFPKEMSPKSQDIWSQRLRDDIARRHLLLQTGFDLVDDSPYSVVQLCGALLVSSSDGLLLLEFARSGSEIIRRKISVAISTLDRRDRETNDAIYRGLSENIVDINLEGLLSVDLTSDLAREAREHFEREEQKPIVREQRVQRKLAELTERLERSEAGDPDAWLRIWDEVLMQGWPDAPRWSGEVQLDQFRCWKLLDRATRDRLYQSAQRFLVSGSRQPLDFIGGHSWPSRAAAEFAALFNTIERSPDAALTADNNLWQRWSTLALWYAFTGLADRDRAVRVFLAKRTQPFVAALGEILDVYIQQGRCSSLTANLRFDWPPQIAHYILDRIRRLELTDFCWNDLYAVGMVEAPELFEKYLWEEYELLQKLISPGRNARLVTVINLLLRNSRTGTWTALRNVIFAEPSIGKDAIAEVSDITQLGNWTQKMGDGEIAELFIWMTRQYSEDAGMIQGASAIAFKGDFAVRTLRDTALVGLRNRGNSTVFRSVLQALPEVDWLPEQVAYVEEAHFRNQWKVETPKGLLQMAKDNAIPWYATERYQTISLYLALLGVGVGIANVLVVNTTARVITVAVAVSLLLPLLGKFIGLKRQHRPPASIADMPM